jgi:glycosyltransferase involved in cell wall biosynthesis
MGHRNDLQQARRDQAKNQMKETVVNLPDTVAPVEKTPHLSVVVPVYNSTNELKQCLAALAASNYHEFEVLVVDDGSTEPIKPLVDARGFRYVRIEGPGGPARARNHGVILVDSPYVLFIDADVCVHPETLERVVATLSSDSRIDAVIGSYDESPARPNFMSQYKNLFHHYVHQESDGVIGTFWTGCGAIKRELFISVGGFDEVRYRRPAIEDIELGTWLTASGHRIVLNSQIKVKHLKHWTLRSVFKTDIFDRGIPWTRLMLRAGALANTLNVTPLQRLNVLMVYLTLLMLPAALMSPLFLFPAAGLALAIALLNWKFYRFFLHRSGWWFTLKVVPLHWLYFYYCGLSFMCGTVMHYLTKEKPRSLTPLTAPDLVAGNCEISSR